MVAPVTCISRTMGSTLVPKVSAPARCVSTLSSRRSDASAVTGAPVRIFRSLDFGPKTGPSRTSGTLFLPPKFLVLLLICGTVRGTKGVQPPTDVDGPAGRDLIPIACPSCFSNFGFRSVVTSFGTEIDGVCPQCGAGGSRKIDRKGLIEAITDFFVLGSHVPETYAPVYQRNETNSSPAHFDSTLDADAKLACQLTGSVVFHYGPPLWRIGMTNHYDEFQQGGSVRRTAAESLTAQAATCTVAGGTRLFRIRANIRADEHISTAVVFDPPPPDIERIPGRWDDINFPVLYVSDDIELCLHECRTMIADEILLATLIPTRDVHLLDLTQELPRQGGTPFDDPNIFIGIMCRSRGRWLDFCREISRAAHGAGYDGIRYVSYYAQAKADVQSINLGLFGRPIANGLLKVNSVNRVRIADMKYAIRFGPVLYQEPSMTAELAGMKSKWELAVDAGLETRADG